MRAVIIFVSALLAVQQVLGSPIYGSNPRRRTRGGSGSRYGGRSSGGGGSWGGSYSSYRYNPSTYHVPSKTLSRIMGSTSANLPRAGIRIMPPFLSRPIRVMYSAAGHRSEPYYERDSDDPVVEPRIDGYLYGTLSSIGLTNDSDPYVPFRRRFQDYLTTTTTVAPKANPVDVLDELMPALNGSATLDDLNYAVNGSTTDITTTTSPPLTTKMVDLCTLVRWNRELQFTEVPNMYLSFISDDVVSGNSTADKEQFTYKFFEYLLRAYAAHNSSWDVFKIPAESDVDACNIQSVEQLENVNLTDEPTGNVEEPIRTAARNMIRMYSNLSTPDNLLDVVSAAEACLPGSKNPGWPYDVVLPCLDFSLTPDQLISVNDTDSMFGNNEICRIHLNHNLLQCESYSRAATCRLDHLVTLNAFARNYYLCPTELEDRMVSQVRERISERPAYENWKNTRPVLVSAKCTTPNCVRSMTAIPNTTAITNDNQSNTTDSVPTLTTNFLQLNITNVREQL